MNASLSSEEEGHTTLSLSPISLAEAEARAEVLRQKLNQASHAYYVLAAPILPDQEYDRLYQELLHLEKRYPQVVRPDSPTQRVGEPVEAGLLSVTHRIPLLSLNDVFTTKHAGGLGWEKTLRSELGKWEKTLRDKLKKSAAANVSPDQPLAYVCELKVDGFALALRYEQGLLVQGATRGDGQQGEEITAGVRTICSIPLRLQCPEPPAWVEVRGEAFLSEDMFSAINQQLRNQGEKPFANARNACAGTFRQLDPQMVASRKVDFFAYQLYLPAAERQPRQQREALDWLNAAGFKVDPYRQLCPSLREVEEFYRHWKGRHRDLSYCNDGIVVKLNDLALQQQVGNAERYPHWAAALKFPTVEATTTLRRIVAQVGRTGVITPVAEFDPVDLGTSTEDRGVSRVTRATLHNADRIADLTNGAGLHVGDTLVVRKAGGVIPEVVSVKPCSSPGKPLAFPRHCPKCGSLLVRESKESKELAAATRCINRSCPAILRGALRHWASRDALHIDGLGHERIEQLAERGLVHTIDALYGLREADLTALEGWAAPSARSLLQSLELSKQQPWHRVLYGLGIPHVGASNAKVLAQAFPSVEELVAAFVQYQGADEPLLAGLQGISPAIALSLQTWLRDPAHQKRLADHEAFKEHWWPLVLTSLKIPRVGPGKAKALAQAFPSGDQLVAAFVQCQGTDEPLPASLQSISQKIQTWLSDPAHKKRLADHEACKEYWWPVVLSGLIPHVGPEKARVLAQAFPSAEQLAEAFAVNRQFQGAGKQHLADLEGVGHEIAFSLQTWLGNPANQKLLERLAKAGLQFRNRSDLSTERAPGPLTGQTFVLTGTLPSLSRAGARKQIEVAGGTVSNSVTKKTTHLVVGANPSSKLDKARALGVAILDEAELLQRLVSPQDLQEFSAVSKKQTLGDDLPLLRHMGQESACW